MADYPTPQEIRDSLTTEALAALVADLPSYSTAPITLVNLDLPSVTPEIVVAYGALIKAVRTEYPTATASPVAITRPQTRDELEGHAIQGEQTRVYHERLEAAK
jgi:hypothetical protein